MNKEFDKVVKLHFLFRHTRGLLTFAGIRDHLQCSDATVYRVLQELEDEHHAPIKRSRNPPGYFYTDRGFDLLGHKLPPDEVQKLLAMQNMMDSFQPGLFQGIGATAKAEFQKLLQSLGLANDQSHRIRMPRARYRLPGAALGDVVSAVLERRRIKFRYDPRSKDDGASEREVSPQRLTHYRDVWYLDAWCYLRNCLRTFSVDRIVGAVLSDTPAEDIAEATLDHELTTSYGIMSGAPTAIAILLVTPWRARWLRDEIWHPNEVKTLLEDGSLRMEIPFNRKEELVNDILSCGRDMKVIGPPELQEEVAKQLMEAAMQYR